MRIHTDAPPPRMSAMRKYIGGVNTMIEFEIIVTEIWAIMLLFDENWVAFHREECQNYETSLW